MKWTGFVNFAEHIDEMFMNFHFVLASSVRIARFWKRQWRTLAMAEDKTEPFLAACVIFQI